MVSNGLVIIEIQRLGNRKNQNIKKSQKNIAQNYIRFQISGQQLEIIYRMKMSPRKRKNNIAQTVNYN